MRTFARVIVYTTLLVGLLIVWGVTTKVESGMPIGEKWELVVEKPRLPIAEGVSGVRLYRRTPADRTCIAKDVFAMPRDLGDDCLGYETSNLGGRRYFLACGDREPLLVAESKAYEQWIFTDRELTKEGEITPEGAVLVPAKRIPVEGMKAAALAQPTRSKKSCE